MDRHQSSSTLQIPLSTLHRKSPILKKLDKATTFDISNIFQPRLGPRLPRQVLINLPLPNTAWKSDKQNQPIIGKPLPSWLYPSNQIRTAKYSLITFIPRNLLEQFRRIANVFFLILVILQFIPKFSQVSPILACLPLLVVLGVTAAKDAYEDVKRHQADSNTNSQTVHILRSSSSSSSASSSDYLNPNLTQPKKSAFKIKWLQRQPKSNKDAATLASEAQARNSISDGPTIVKKHWWDRKLKVPNSSDKLEKSHTGHSSLPSHLDHDLQSPVSPNRPHDHHHHGQVKFRRSAWEDLRVGDFVRLRNDEPVPADIIICSTSDEEENVCFIETKNLDGETNLKSRHAIKELTHLRSVSDCLRTQDSKNRFVIESEAPDPNLFKYNAALVFPEIKLNSIKSQLLEPTEKPREGQDALRVAVNLNTILLRGTVVRNTDWVIGVVVFTGPDTKIMMNSSGTPSKRSKVERLMNPMVFINLGLLAIMCLFNGIGTHLAERYYYDRNSYWTVYSDSSDDNPNINGAVGFANAMITYQNIVPISLYISIEFVRTMQALFIWADDHLYYRPTKKRTIARSWNLSDDLGQIQYIFSDKTGTLTQNLMQFRQCCIGGKVYSGMDRLGPIVEVDEDETVGGGEPMGSNPSDELTKFTSKDLERAESRQLNSPITPLKPTHRVTARSLSTGSSDSTGPNPRLKKKASEPSVVNSADPEATELPTIEPFQDLALIHDLSDPKSDQARLIHGFFATLGLCHTVLATEDETGTIQYKAQSPDESALVQAAADVGFVFRGRERNVLRLQVPSDLAKTRARSRLHKSHHHMAAVDDSGIELVDQADEADEDTEINEYELLEVNEFTSARKRMSVVVRRLDSTDGRSRQSSDGLPTGEIFLLVKGADNVIFERLGAGQDEIKQKTDDQLEEFAGQGLRTLCLAYRQLKEDEFLSWSSKYTNACSQVGPEREKGIETVQDELEHSLHLLGATAIEDKLQDGVPETIAELKRAGIKVWVATGDKLETAVAIARSCNLIAKDMNLIVIRGGAYGTRSSTYSQLRKALVDFFDADELVENLKEMPPDYVVNSERRPSRFSTHSEAQTGVEPIDLDDIVGEDNGNREGGYGLVIDGASLHHAFEEVFTKEILLELSTRCQAVVCCRTSPKQKAEIVTLVKDGTNSMTLAIGDGANDVSMIQAADIGIGVSGEEGLQAVNSSDYAIGQFRYLSRLLFVHGHWSYDRNSRMILNFFYKEIIGISVLWFFQFWCAYSTTTYYEYTYLLFYNVFWTLLPVLGIGVFDQDIRQRVLVSVPELYSVGRDGKLFGLKNFIWYMAQGIYQGAVCYFFIAFAYDTTSPRSDGFDVDINEVSSVVIVAVIIACNAYHALNQFAWNIFMTVFVLVGPVLILLYTAIYSAIEPSMIWTTVYGNNYYLWAAPYWWFGLLFTVVVCLLPQYLVKYYREMYHPTDLEILRYIDRIDPEHDYKTDPQMPYIRELSKYDNNEGGGAMVAKQPTHSSLEPGLARVERTRTSISVTHDMATGQASPSGVGRGFGFDQADGVGEIAVGNRLRRFNSSRLSIPEETRQRANVASSSRDRTRSIRIGNLEIGAGGVRIGSPRNSHGHNNKLAKRISDFIHHPRPKSSGSDNRTRTSERTDEETDELQRRTGEGLSVILDPPTEDLEPSRTLNQSTNSRNGHQLSSGVAPSSLNPPSFPSINSSMVLSDRHGEQDEVEEERS